MRTRREAFAEPETDQSKAPPACENTSDPDVGEKVTVSFPEMVFVPKQYSSFRVGGLVAETTVRPGETRVLAMRRAMRDLARFVDADFDQKLDQYLSLGVRMVKALEGK